MTAMTRDQVLETVREARAAGRPANLCGADLTCTTLADADLTDTNLRGVDLADANLTDANLTDAWLADADLTCATLNDTNLTGALLEGAHFTPQQLLDTRGLRPGRRGLPRDTWDELLPTNPQQRQLVEHLLNDGWGGTVREAIATVEGLAGR